MPVGFPCLFRIATGLDCPGCGGTRATRELLRLDIVAALDLNALWVLLVPILATAVLIWLRAAVRHSPNPLGPVWARLQRWVLPAVGAWWVVRNLPFEPFSALGT